MNINYKKWTPEENALLKSLYEINSKEFISSKFVKPWNSIKTRARKLGLHRTEEAIMADRKIRYSPRSDAWTVEEDKLLREIYEHNTKEFILSKINRTWRAIWSRAYECGLHRDGDIVEQEMIEAGKNAPPGENVWSKEEDGLLGQVYENNRRKFILEKFKNRTWKAIRERSTKLGLRRNQKMVNEDKLETAKKNTFEKYGVESTWQLDSVKQKSKQTNMERRGVEYALQSPGVRAKIKITVKKRYGVDNIFQSESIKEKIRQTNLIKFGAENPNQNPGILEKSKVTNRERYGMENPFQMIDRVRMGMIKKYGEAIPLRVPEIIEKKRGTNLKKYGFEFAQQNSEVRKKIETTNLERYGTKVPQTNELIKQKIKKTNLKKYGVDNPLKSKVIQEKCRQSLYKYGTQKCSMQQKYIADLLKGKINFPVGNCNVDILLDNNIILEYDGGGHNLGVKLGYTSQKESINLERKRDLYLKSQNFSIIRIISKNDLLPKDSILIKIVFEAREYLKKGHSWITYDIDNKKILCSKYQMNYDFDKLRKIRTA